MIANYFKIGLRILYRHKGYTIMNILGLAIGIAVFVFIYLYVQSEIRYDRKWSDADHIYRVWNEYALDKTVEKIAISPFRIASDLNDFFREEVSSSTKLFFTDPSDVNDMTSLTYGDKVYEIPEITLSDENLFGIFDYPILSGNKDSLLVKPNSIVISSEVARKIFGNQDPIGKNLSTIRREYTVTGVFEKSQFLSHLNFDAVVSQSSLNPVDIERLRHDWFRMQVYTYVKLDDSVNVASFEQRFNNFVRDSMNAFIDSTGIAINGYTKYHFERIRDVHFNTGLKYDSPTNTDFSYLVIFSLIAGFILLTASINYINLAMARSLRRAKEIGVRKVLGAYRKQLMVQHITESVIVTSIAFVISLSLVELLMPRFNELVGKQLTLVGTLFSEDGIFFGLLLVLLIAILATISGIFPAFILSAFNPVNVLKGNNFFFSIKGRQRLSAGSIRKVLVIIQYVVSIGMIIATAIVFSQMNFLKEFNLGFDKENVYVINVPDDTSFAERAEKFAEAIRANDNVVDVSLTLSVPGYTYGKWLYTVGNDTSRPLQTISNFVVDNHFFNILNIPLVEGGYFTQPMRPDTAREYIINEAAAKFLNLEHPVGTEFDASVFDSVRGKIIGVVSDFNYTSLYAKVEPLVFMNWEENKRYILVKYKPQYSREALLYVQNIWDKFNPGHYMHFTELSDKLSSLYDNDSKMLSIFMYFSLFVIFISSLGLYGLSSFLIEQRTKEIGIRKILGGSERRIVLHFARDYLRLVLLAGLIASPIVYVLMKRWLETFAFHIDMNGWYFAGGICAGLLFSFFTVMARLKRVVKQNPAYALKYE